MTSTGGPVLADAALLVATVLVGLSAGFFYTYEASVTVGLTRIGDAAYVETFQAINETIRNPAFGIVFFGSIPAVIVAVSANWRRSSAAARVLLAAALPLYLAGLAITAAGNVPLNNELADTVSIEPEDTVSIEPEDTVSIEPEDTVSIEPEDLENARAEFEADWNRLNLIRALFIGAGFVSLAAVPLAARPGPEGD